MQHNPVMHGRSTCLENKIQLQKKEKCEKAPGYKVYPQRPDGGVWVDHGCLVASDCTVVHCISMEMDG